MKKIIILFSFLYSINAAHSQIQNEDSILHRVDASINDTTQIIKIFESLGNISEINPILDMKITQKLLVQAVKTKDKENEARFLADIAYDYRAFGNYTKAMEYALRSTTIAEETGKESIIATTKFNIAHIYKDQGDYQKAIKLYKVSEKIWLEKNDYKSLSHIYMNLGQVYLYMNKIDSALMYEQHAYEICTRINYTDYLCNILEFLGSIQGKMGNQSLALSYFNLSVKEAYKINSPRFKNQIYTSIAQYYHEAKQNDSSLIYAKKAIDAVKNTAFSNKNIKAAKLLLEIYLKVNSDSALKYSEIYRIANDSMYSAKIIQQTQMMSFENELREQQIYSEKKQEEEQRNQYIQFALIALAIVSLLILYLLLSHSFITNSRLIEFFGVIALLIVFEFLNLLLHPFLEKVTNHSPVFMLLILVGIAALLVPIHHRVEKWATKKLVEKNKQVRLANAKKTIRLLSDEKLEKNS